MNTNPGVAQASSFYIRNWIPHGITSQYCPPTCPLNQEEEDKLYKVDFEELLTKKGEHAYLEEWKQIPEWDNGDKIFDRRITPTFQSMDKKEVFEKIEENVKKYKESKIENL